MTLSPSQSAARRLERTAPSPGEASLLILLRQAEGALRLRMQRSLGEAGLSHEHWRIMSFLLEHPGERMTAIGEAAVLPSASLTRHVDRLVEIGMVVRRIDRADRRSSVVALSPRGRQLADQLRAEESALEAELEAALGAEALTAMRRALADAPGALR